MLPRSIGLILACLLVLASQELTRINQKTGKITEEVAGIIVSFRSGASYDNLFSSVKQESKEGSIVLTYLAHSKDSKEIVEVLSGEYRNVGLAARELAGEVERLTEKCSACVVLNWECSSGFSNEKFGENDKYIFQLLEMAIKRGYLVMFSDFSLKALIKNWKPQILGPNPFVKVGQTSTTIDLKFQKDRLLRCPSSQLQAVARLAESDELSVHVLGGTIMYGVDSRVDHKDKYELEVLTVASNFPAPHSYLESSVGNHKGLAGHILLSYKSGGKLLTSMGHWIELMNIDTSEQQLFAAANILYSQEQEEKIKTQYSTLKTAQEKKAYRSKKSMKYIQNQSPGSNAIYLQEMKEKPLAAEM